MVIGSGGGMMELYASLGYSNMGSLHNIKFSGILAQVICPP